MLLYFLGIAIVTYTAVLIAVARMSRRTGFPFSELIKPPSFTDRRVHPERSSASLKAYFQGILGGLIALMILAAAGFGIAAAVNTEKGHQESVAWLKEKQADREKQR